LCGSVVSLCAQVTEWTTTVKPGHFLLEMDAISLTVDREPGSKYTALGLASTFLTTGLTDKWDVQIGAEFYIQQKFDVAGFTDRDSGVGDVYLRTKYRFYESSETYTTAAILPWIKVPTSSGNWSNDAIEGGIILPWSTQVLGGFDVYAMVELDFLRNDANDGYDSYWYGSAAFSRSVTRFIGLYGEVTAGKSSGSASTEGTLGAGITITVSEHAWWDIAVYKGISDSAADWQQVVRFNWGF
jgi:hypothetical protein